MTNNSIKFNLAQNGELHSIGRLVSSSHEALKYQNFKGERND
ncbi:MAG: hypothetical protein V3U87_17850 [Methylococcaceae bacterium]